MSGKATLDLFSLLVHDMWGVFRYRIVALSALMVANGLMEGLSMALLFPLLTMVGIGSGDQNSSLSNFFDELFGFFAIQMTMGVVLGVLLSAFLLQAIVFIAQSWLEARLQHAYGARWRRDLFRAYMSAGLPFFVRCKAGDLTNVFINETNRLTGAFHLSVHIASIVVITAIYLALALFVSWQVTLLLIATAVVLMLATRGIVVWSRGIGQALGPLGNRLQTLAQELLGGAKMIKATATEAEASRVVDGVVTELEQHFFWSTLHPNFIRVIYEVVSLTMICLILVAGTSYLGIAAADIIVILALFVRLFPRFTGLQQNVQQLNVYLPAVALASSSLAEAKSAGEQVQEGGELPPGFADGPCSIKIEHLHCGYGDKKVLQDVHIDIPAGKISGIVGGSGAGKTTLADCLLRFVEPRKGSIYINGQCLSNLPLAAWRRKVGYVAQETFLFHASIRDNLLWGQHDISEEKMVLAFRQAHAHDFIMALPQGYDTMVGERGTRLSGGQRQRLGLAQALVGDPVLLILDEATSALDSESELAVLDAIRQLRGSMTIISIAHRLSSLRDADTIYVLEEGRIVEHGSWDALMAKKGRLEYLWKLQQRR